jgi:hypothetical protein
MNPDLTDLFTRPFWLDEWHTNLVGNRETISQLFSDLHRGSDFGPPLVHLIAWVLARLGGGEVTPIGARIASLTAVLLALVFVFLVLRRRFGVAGAGAGALAVASHQLVVSHAFELRFYSLWLACAAGFAWSLTVDRERPASRRRDGAIAAFSILLCMTHWLAVTSLGLMCVAAMASFGRQWRAGLRHVAPAAAGFVVLALATPLVFGQRGSITEKSWMPDVTFENVLYTVNVFWGGKILVFGVLVILFGLLRDKNREPVKSAFRDAVRDPGTTALLSLAAVPLAMVVVSILQPAMHHRYSITALLAWAPVVAIAVHSYGKVMRSAFYLILLGFFWVALVNMTVEASRFAWSAGVGQKALAQACTMKVPVVFEVRHLMYPSTSGASKRWGDCDTRYLAVSSATLDRMFPAGSNLPRFFRIENEFAYLHNRLYDYPRVATQAHLDSVPRFLLVGWDDSFPIGYKDVHKFGQAVFPNHRVTRVTEDLALFERR